MVWALWTEISSGHMSIWVLVCLSEKTREVYHPRRVWDKIYQVSCQPIRSQDYTWLRDKVPYLVCCIASWHGGIHGHGHHTPQHTDHCGQEHLQNIQAQNYLLIKERAWRSNIESCRSVNNSILEPMITQDYTSLVVRARASELCEYRDRRAETVMTIAM